MQPSTFQTFTYLVLPPDFSEEQIVELLSSAGPVTKFRLMTHPESGKPKGFGFADFADADSAASAVRNLNDHEIGKRRIRVAWPDHKDKDSAPADYTAQPQMPPDSLNGQQGQSQPLPPLPPGRELPPNLKCTDAISQTLSTLPPTQLLDVLTQMKGLVMTDPSRATELLRQAPQLSYAIFQALILMNLIDYNVLGSVVEQTAQPTSQAGPSQPPPRQMAPQYQHPQIPGQGYMPTPPMHQQQQFSTPQPAPSSQAPPPMSQEEMLRQVMAMDQGTIDSLPPMERSQIMQLRQQLGVR